jgi:hypothetical protein
VLDAIGFANDVEPAQARENRAAVSRLLGELDAVVGQDRVELVRNDDQDLLQELARGSTGGLLTEPGDGKLRRPINGYEQVKLAFACADLGDVDVEEADRVALELLLGG